MNHSSTHPLIQHKVSILRDTDTGNKKFRELTNEITTLVMYEATQELELIDSQVTTPMATMTGKKLSSEVVFIPIIRAGLGMLDAALDVVPTAKVGFLGMERDSITHAPKSYYNKLPDDKNASIFILDPMLATAGSVIASIELLQKEGYLNITVVCIISSQYGLELLNSNFPNINIFTAATDQILDENKYIVPGLGDAGDRLYGTEV